ncbi:MAG: Arc family DNA-binding protein [Pantoea agglomerans]
MKGASQIAPFGLRMPEDLKEIIAERAAKNGRSMNSEIILTLMKDLATESKPDKWLESLMRLMDEADTSTDKGMAVFNRSVSAAIREINERIALENGRLSKIADAYAKVLLEEKEKPT